MDFSHRKKTSLLETPSTVDGLALTKKSTIEGFMRIKHEKGKGTTKSDTKQHTCLTGEYSPAVAEGSAISFTVEFYFKLHYITACGCCRKSFSMTRRAQILIN